MVGDDPKLPADGGEIPKPQERGWRFNSQVWNLLSTWQKTCQVINYLLCFGVGLSPFCLDKKNEKTQPNGKKLTSNRCKKVHPSPIIEGELSTTKCAPLLRCVIKDRSCRFPVSCREKRVQIATALYMLSQQDQTEAIDQVSNGRDSLEEKQINAKR